MANVSDKIVKVDHIGVAVHNVQRVRKVWKKVFGLEGELHEYPEVGMRGLIIWVGDTHFKFTEPTAPSERWDSFLKEHGEGINHIALEVKDLASVMKALQKDGIAFRHERPVQFADGICNFIDMPELCMTIELAELRPNWKEIKFKPYED